MCRYTLVTPCHCSTVGVSHIQSEGLQCCQWLAKLLLVGMQEMWSSTRTTLVRVAFCGNVLLGQYLVLHSLHSLAYAAVVQYNTCQSILVHLWITNCDQPRAPCAFQDSHDVLLPYTTMQCLLCYWVTCWLQLHAPLHFTLTVAGLNRRLLYWWICQ